MFLWHLFCFVLLLWDSCSNSTDADGSACLPTALIQLTAFAHFLPASDVFDSTARHIPDAEFFDVKCRVYNTQQCKQIFNGLKLHF